MTDEYQKGFKRAITELESQALKVIKQGTESDDIDVYMECLSRHDFLMSCANFLKQIKL